MLGDGVGLGAAVGAVVGASVATGWAGAAGVSGALEAHETNSRPSKIIMLILNTKLS
jgi:hypothetical protein